MHVNDIIAIASQASKKYALANIKAGIDIIVTADPTASGSLISPQTFEALAAPYQKEIANAVTRAGAIPSLHICGKTTQMLEQMAATEAKILELDHLVDLVEAKKRVGHKVTLMGNLNPTELLLTGTSVAVKAAAKTCIETVGRNGRYILSSGCEVPPLAPIENIRAMVTAADKYGHYS